MDTSTEVMKVETGTVTQYSNYDTGLSRIKVDPSQIVLVQPTVAPALGCMPGVLMDRETNKIFSKMQVVPIILTFPRALFPPSNERDPKIKPICRSNDGVLGIGANGLDPISVYCIDPITRQVVCPKASWAKYNRVTKTGKPECSEFYRLTFVEKVTKLPYFISVETGRTSYFALVNCLKAIRKEQLIEQAASGSEPPLWAFTFEMTSVKQMRGSSQVYYVLQFNNIQRLENPAEFGPLFEQFAKVAVSPGDQTPAEDHVESVINAEYTEI